MSKTLRRRRLILRIMLGLTILLTGQLMASMDASILVVASPSLRSELHATGAELQLIVAGYTLAFGTLVVIGARVGDIIGRPRAFVLGLWGFVTASLLGGLAPSAPVLVGARVIQGASAALLTPQVLSIIQLRFDGQARARAIGAYSTILAVGVAAGQIVGGLLVSADLFGAAWRPALLLNAPIGLVLLAGSRRALPRMPGRAGERLDLRGAALLAVALFGLIVPLTFGRGAGWPPWIWPCFGLSVAALGSFVRHERRCLRTGGRPLFDLDVLKLPGIAAGIVSVLLVMGAYAGILLSLTLLLQRALHFSALHAGLTFALYAGGFACASLTWTRTPASVRDHLPLIGPVAMGSALLALGLLVYNGSWHGLVAAPLLFAGGAGHACAFSPLANRLAATVRPAQAADLSGLILTASLVGQTLGVAAFVGIYLAAAGQGADTAGQGAGHALAITTAAIAATLLVTSVLQSLAVLRPGERLDVPTRRLATLAALPRLRRARALRSAPRTRRPARRR